MTSISSAGGIYLGKSDSQDPVQGFRRELDSNWTLYLLARHVLDASRSFLPNITADEYNRLKTSYSRIEIAVPE